MFLSIFFYQCYYFKCGNVANNRCLKNKTKVARGTLLIGKVKTYANLSSGLYGRAVLDEQLHHLYAILLAGDMQRREAVEGPCVRVGFAVEQQLRHPYVSTMRGHVQRRQIVDRYLVHRCPMVQQHSRRVHVVALRCHMQRRQSILSYRT